MAQIVLALEVVKITRKGEQLGYKVYITENGHCTKLPRKPGDIKARKILPGEYKPLEYYPLSVSGAITQALQDWDLWAQQGYKPNQECGNMQSCGNDWRHVCRLPKGHEGDCVCDVCGVTGP